MTDSASFDVVVPTTGRDALRDLLLALAAQRCPLPGRVLLVDDRRRATLPLLGELPPALRGRVRVLAGEGRGPAAARNRGWRTSDAEWVAFLDDDVLPDPDWSVALADDLASLPAAAGGSQGRVQVPLPPDRPASDWERDVAGLRGARWITADMAYRRCLLEQLGGFDERFAHAYREDADLALRAQALGWTLHRGGRRVRHPVGSASFWVSVRRQRGNGDDALMRRLHGRGWRERSGQAGGRFPRHLATTSAFAATVGLGAVGSMRGNRRGGRAMRRAAGLSAALAGGQFAELAWARIAPGPRTAGEIARMLLTSAAIPFAAVYHRLRGELRWRKARPLPGRLHALPAAILFDRDGTLVEDVPYNGDPSRVRPMPGAREALCALRAAGVPLAVVSNQSGIARGLLDERQLRAVNRRIEELLGPFELWLCCPHGPEDGCDCRKPRPGSIRRAAELLGVPVSRCAVVGDIGSDMLAAIAAGARGVLVPTSCTRWEEVAAAPEVAWSLPAAVSLLLGEAA